MYANGFKMITALLCCFVGWFSSCPQTQVVPSLTVLLERLRMPDTTDQAAKEILDLAKSNESVRHQLGVQLSPMIERNPHTSFRVWMNAVQLAGDLKVAEASPALAKWITVVADETADTPKRVRLEANPAAKALQQIGDPAVPSLRGTLAHGDLHQRRYAVLILKLIGSATASDALREHLKHESDQGLREVIQDALLG
jgi:HEAT repeat protein